MRSAPRTCFVSPLHGSDPGSEIVFDPPDSVQDLFFEALWIRR